MSPKKAKRANELPYIPLGPFQWRIPGIHYRVEYVEFFQGLILGATALSSIPYLTDNLGLPYELAWSCVIIEVFIVYASWMVRRSGSPGMDYSDTSIYPGVFKWV